MAKSKSPKQPIKAAVTGVRPGHVIFVHNLMDCVNIADAEAKWKAILHGFACVEKCVPLRLESTGALEICYYGESWFGRHVLICADGSEAGKEFNERTAQALKFLLNFSNEQKQK